MKLVARVSLRFRMLLVATGLVSATATALAVAPDSYATYINFSCASCHSTFAPSVYGYVQNTYGIDYTHGQSPCADVWRGSGINLTAEADVCATQPNYTAIACAMDKNNYGYGDVYVNGSGNGHLAGTVNNYTYCGN